MNKNEKLFEDLRKSVTECWNANQTEFQSEPKSIKLHEPTFGPEEIIAHLECMLSTRITMGPKVRAFEKEISNKFGTSNSVLVNSGSSANLLALAALVNPDCEDGLKEGDEVIVPALSWSTTVWPIVQMGLTPVIVDIDSETLNIDPNKIEEAITPKTRAIMIVPVYGNPCDMDAITEISERNNLILIEDCCESMGAKFNGQSVGTFGRVGTYSFYYSHHITTMEGGVCMTADDDLSELMRVLRSHGWARETERPTKIDEEYSHIDPRFLFVNLGYNLRLTDPQAAMGSVQLPKLDHFIDQRRKTAAEYKQGLSKFSEYFDFQTETPGGFHTWFGFPIVVKKTAPFSVKSLIAALKQHSIETRPIIVGNIAKQPAMKKFHHRVCGDLANSSAVMERGFSFGNHQSITESDRSRVIAVISDFMRAV